MKRHTKSDGLPCPVCNMKVANSSRLSVHLKRHEDQLMHGDPSSLLGRDELPLPHLPMSRYVRPCVSIRLGCKLSPIQPSPLLKSDSFSSTIAPISNLLKAEFLFRHLKRLFSLTRMPMSGSCVHLKAVVPYSLALILQEDSLMPELTLYVSSLSSSSSPSHALPSSSHISSSPLSSIIVLFIFSSLSFLL